MVCWRLEYGGKRQQKSPCGQHGEMVSEQQLRYNYINIEHSFAITIAFPKKVCYSKRVQQQQKMEYAMLE